MNQLLNLSTDYLQSLKIVDWSYTEEDLPLTYDHYEEWLAKGLEGPLHYLADERKEKRKSLKNLYPDFQSSLVFLFDYTSEKKRLIESQEKYQIASYVTGFDGVDYHYWIKEKLNEIATNLGLENYTFSIDAQPVLERDLAYKAGLGWFGKNTMLISKRHGSYFLIGSILLNTKLGLNSNSHIEADHCGTCTKCIDACPTEAIIDNKILDAKRCISTFTIEEFKPTPSPKGFEEVESIIFGCDICQEVCPWNNKPLQKSSPASQKVEWMSFFNDDLEVLIEKLNLMSNREYRRYFKGTPLERTGRVGMLKNLTAKLKS